MPPITVNIIIIIKLKSKQNFNILLTYKIMIIFDKFLVDLSKKKIKQSKFFDNTLVIMNKKAHARLFSCNQSIHISSLGSTQYYWMNIVRAHNLNIRPFFLQFVNFLLQEFCFSSRPSKIWNNSRRQIEVEIDRQLNNQPDQTRIDGHVRRTVSSAQFCQSQERIPRRRGQDCVWRCVLLQECQDTLLDLWVTGSPLLSVFNWFWVIFLYILYSTGKDDKSKEYYNLECLVFLIKNRDLQHSMYVKNAGVSDSFVCICICINNHR